MEALWRGEPGEETGDGRGQGETPPGYTVHSHPHRSTGLERGHLLDVRLDEGGISQLRGQSRGVGGHEGGAGHCVGGGGGVIARGRFHGLSERERFGHDDNLTVW